MNNFWKIFIRSASLAIIALLLYFGVDLVKNTDGVTLEGSGLIFVGITLSVISFADWRKKEAYEHLIKQQSGVIKDLSSQINEAKKTDATIQKYARGSIDTMVGNLELLKKEKYTTGSDEITQGA